MIYFQLWALINTRGELSLSDVRFEYIQYILSLYSPLNAVGSKGV